MNNKLMYKIATAILITGSTLWNSNVWANNANPSMGSIYLMQGSNSEIYESDVVKVQILNAASTAPLDPNATIFAGGIIVDIDFNTYFGMDPNATFSVAGWTIIYKDVVNSRVQLTNAVDILAGNESFIEIPVIGKMLTTTPQNVVASVNLSDNAAALNVSDNNPNDNNGSASMTVTGIFTPLPITLVDFSVKSLDCNHVEVNWQVSREMDVDQYNVQFSADGKSFKNITTVAARNNINGGYYNTAIFNENLSGYYRLKAIDKDGTSDYSKVVALSSDCTVRNIIMSPNPTRESVTIKGATIGDKVLIVDMKGEVVMNVEAEQSDIKLQLGHLNTGVYLVQVIATNGQQTTIKLVKE